MKQNREILFIVFLCTVLLWFIFDIMEKNNSFETLSVKTNTELSKQDPKDSVEYRVPKSLALGVIDWDRDIFYDRSESYRSLFKLTGISKMRDGYKAFINNKIMSEGDRIKGFIVNRITEKKVVLKKNNSSVTLRL